MPQSSAGSLTWVDVTRAARAVLERGEIVAMPTETVYGLAVRGDRPEALERLRALKGREAIQAFTWHVGDARALEQLGPISPLVQRIVDRYWPGPLTLVLPTTDTTSAQLKHLANDGWIGVRLPAHKGTAAVLRAVDFPVAMTSCNRHGAPPAADADTVEREFGEEIPLLLDGGPSRLAESSSVARLGRGRFELLREGLIDLRQLRQTAGLRIAFVCTGNTCRSPLGEGLAKRLLADRLECRVDQIADFGFEVCSLGVSAALGEPAAKHTLSLLADIGVDLSGHRARAAQDEDLATFDRLYCMTQSHLDALRAFLPRDRVDTAQLLDPVGRNIADPIGGPRESYEHVAGQIRAALEARAADWA